MSLADDKHAAETVNCDHCGHKIGSNGSPDVTRPAFDSEPEDQAFAVVMRSAMSRKIHVNCGSCGRGLKVGLRMAGRKTTCPACSERVRLPLAGQEAERQIEEYIAKRSQTATTSSAKDSSRKPESAPSLMHFDESELAELATYVETDGADDATLEIPDDGDLMHRSADAIEGREILALNAAISAVTPQHSTSAEEELPALQKAVKEHSVQETEGMFGQTKAIIATVAAALIVGIGLWAAMNFMGGSQPDPGLQPEDPPLAVNPDAGPAKKPNTHIKQSPETKPQPIKPVIPKPVKIIAACRAVTSSTDSFAGDGFFPAAPGQIFCRIRVQVKAGDDQLELYNFGKSAVLTIGLDSFESLGESVKSILPTLPRKKRVILPPHKSQTMTMLFQLPQEALGISGAKGIIKIGTIAPVGVTLGNPAHVLPAKAVASKSYMEVAPRNTKPLLSDPVMSAIQSTMPQKLSIIPGAVANTVALKLSGGEVTGSATRDARGLYITKLTHNGSTLDCLLRFAHGGRQAILYLSEEPFHQLTFALPGESRIAPIVPQGSTTIRTPKPSTGVKTVPVKPKPRPRPRPKPRPTNGNGRRPGFFGV